MEVSANHDDGRRGRGACRQIWPGVPRCLLYHLPRFHHVEPPVDLYRGDEHYYGTRRLLDRFRYRGHGHLVPVLSASDARQDVMAISRL